MDILQQLGELVLGSVPTMLLFVFMVIMYRVLVHKPLHRVLAERRKLTVGAIDEARLAIAAAENKTAEYESRLRVARNGIALAREHRVAQWNAERDEVLSAAQDLAQLQVRTAKLEIEESVRDARTQIEASADALAQEILNAVLPQRAAAGEAAR